MIYIKCQPKELVTCNNARLNIAFRNVFRKLHWRNLLKVSCWSINFYKRELTTVFFPISIWNLVPFIQHSYVVASNSKAPFPNFAQLCQNPNSSEHLELGCVSDSPYLDSIQKTPFLCCSQRMHFPSTFHHHCYEPYTLGKSTNHRFEGRRLYSGKCTVKFWKQFAWLERLEFWQHLSKTLSGKVSPWSNNPASSRDQHSIDKTL